MMNHEIKQLIKHLAIAFIFSTISSPALAERSISDSAGFPSKNDFWLTAGMAFVDQEFDVVSTAGARLTSSEQSTTLLATQLLWGLNETMGLGIDINYIVSQDVETISDPDGTPSTTETKTNGLVDPTFRYALRFLKEEDSGFNLDLQTFISPKVFTAKEASTTENGNGGRGQTLLGLGLDFSWDSGPNEFLVTLEIEHLLEGESEEADDSSEISTEASQTNFAIELEYSYELNDRIELSIGESIEIEGEEKSTDSDGSVTTVDSSLSFTTELEVEYHLVPDIQTIELQFLFVIQPDIDARIGTTAVQLKDIKQMAIGLAYKMTI